MLEVNIEKCTGCGACKILCPAKCISLEEDHQGFIFPHVENARCLNCNICNIKCPASNNYIVHYEKQKLYAFVHKDKDVFLNSSSGGAFTAIVDCFFNIYPNGCVFGAYMDEYLELYHSIAYSAEQAYKFRKSKYYQSDLRDTYCQCKKMLDEGKYCMYTGTPCQIAGLKAYLGKYYSNLLLIDILCHGTPNKRIFQSYISEIEKKHGKLLRYTFRFKTERKYGKHKILSSENLLMTLANKKIIVNRHDDPYLIGFHNSLFNRMSCYNCKYATLDRVSDITLSDFWRYEEINSEYDGRSGVSAVIINSSKGDSFFSKVMRENNAILCKIEKMNDLADRNCPLCKGENLNPLRKRFFELWNDDFSKALYACYPKASIMGIVFSKFLNRKHIELLKRMCGGKK